MHDWNGQPVIGLVLNPASRIPTKGGWAAKHLMGLSRRQEQSQGLRIGASDEHIYGVYRAATMQRGFDRQAA